MQPIRSASLNYHLFFPVSLQLMPEEMRQPVQDFYGFIKTMEEICGSNTLPREEKRQQLRLLRITLQENDTELLPEWAVAYHILLEQGRLNPVHGENLWQAFWQDTEKDRYRSIQEVLSYARLAAAPVGRGVLEILGEDEVDKGAVDALCTALMLIRHMQHLRGDYLLRQRVYLPQQWLEEAGISERVLAKKETGPKLRKVFDDWLEEVEGQIRRAAYLPGSVKQRRLRAELKVILACANQLAKKLRREDPMAKKIYLSSWERFWAGIGALFSYR